MKICFVIGDLIGGGSERAVCMLASEMAKNGEDVSILCVPNTDGSYPLNGKVKIVKTKKYNNFFNNFFKRSKDFRRVFKKEKFDVIVPFTTQKNVCVLFASLFTKNKVIICERNDPNRDPKSRFLRILRKILYWRCNGAVFQTEDAKKYFSKKMQNKSIVIPNAIDLSKVQPFLGKRKNRVVTVGRLEPEKNTIMAIKAFESVCGNKSVFNLDIYGDGPEKNTLEKYILENELTNVHLKGFRNNIFDEIKDAKVFLFPSNYEGISNALMEALALGIPTISTNHPIGGAKLLINNGVNGFLVGVNDLDNMKLKLKDLISNEALQNSFSEKAIETISKNFGIEQICKKWILYFKSI